MRVRIKNFQSIKDAEIEISGFTVITGTNNSGKTAVMRAIRGVFTNAPAGPLLRRGEAYLSVTIHFDDGNTVTWEKGWEKPDRKGKTVNRYIVNGKTLPNVGRSAPEEVRLLGVGEIRAGSDRIWPQIADQVTGSLFLVDRPGSVMAEALSDVERVGKLSSALRLSESDRRSVSDRLRIRREDLENARTNLSHYEGLDDILPLASDLRDRKASLDALRSRITEANALLDRLNRARSRAAVFENFDPNVVPDDEVPCLTAQRLAESKTLLETLQSRRAETEQLRSWDGGAPIPETTPSSTALDTARALWKRLASAQARVSALPSEVPTVPDPEPVVKIRKAIGIVSSFEETLRSRADAVALLDIRAAELDDDLVRVESEITTLLGDRGLCPTCGAVHTDTSHTEKEAIG